MPSVWAQRHAELLSDCIVSPDVFTHMVDRLRSFVVPYQQAFATNASQRNVHLYLTKYKKGAEAVIERLEAYERRIAELSHSVEVKPSCLPCTSHAPP